MKPLFLGLFAAATAVSCGGAGDPSIWLECPSPNGETTANIFYQSGGGAAGWTEFTIALQRANLPPSLPGKSGSGPSQPVLVTSDATRLSLRWESDVRLSVESVYLGYVSLMAHDYYPKNPSSDPYVHVRFNEREPSPADTPETIVSCHSGDREIVNPPPRRLSPI